MLRKNKFFFESEGTNVKACIDAGENVEKLEFGALGYIGRAMLSLGVPIAHKDVRTKHQESMQFWAFEDETGVFHAVVFPQAYERFCRLFVTEKVLLISGVVEEEYGAVSVHVGRMSRVNINP